jgi:hypothetical protein
MKRWRTCTIIREEPVLASLPQAQAVAMADALERRLRWWWPGLAGTLVMWAWIIFMTIAMELSDDTIFDIKDLIRAAHPLDDVVGVFLFLVIGAVLGLLTLLEVRRSMIRRAIRRHLRAPLCFWCGYSLRGLSPLRVPNQISGWLITCPECGSQSAVGHN